MPSDALERVAPWTATTYGEICEKIYKLVDLEVLSLDHNALSGEVPPKIKKLKKLERLWLGSNKLTGMMPVWLTKLDKLRTLDLHDNMFGGYLLPTLRDSTNLKFFGLTLIFSKEKCHDRTKV